MDQGLLAESQIVRVVERIVEAALPQRVILFGSYARGDADGGSDVDLLVVERNVPDPVAEMVRLRQVAGNIGVGVDIVVMSERDLEQRQRLPGTLAYEAVREGKVLHDATR